MKKVVTQFALMVAALLIAPSGIVHSQEAQMRSMRLLSPGRASRKAIEKNDPEAKMATCRDGASVGAMALSAEIPQEIQVFGKPENPMIMQQSSGQVENGRIGSCKSTLNDFEECLCEIEFASRVMPESLFQKAMNAKDGLVDGDTAVFRTKGEGRAGGPGEARRQVQCTTAARLKGYAGLGFLLYSGKKKGDDLNITFHAPSAWTECRSTDAMIPWASCECTVVFYEKNLKANVKKSMVSR